MSDPRFIANHACPVANLAHTLVVQDGDTITSGRRKPPAGWVEAMMHGESMYRNLRRGSATDAAVPPAQPAATLVILRDGEADLEVLLLRRSRELSAFAGVWVFPGGAAEAADGPTDGWRAPQTTARNTAVRELAEETGLVVDPAGLVPLARWTAPVVMTRRFDTWFFMGISPGAPVCIDQGEIHDHRWIAPREALERHRTGRMPLFPPTWVTLHHLTAFRRCAAALAASEKDPPYHFAPKVVPRGEDTCFLYGGDQAYEDPGREGPGPRHRLWVRREGWQYECTPDSGGPYASSAM